MSNSSAKTIIRNNFFTFRLLKTYSRIKLEIIANKSVMNFVRQIKYCDLNLL